MGIDFASGFGREPEMAAPIAIQRAEGSFALDYLFQPRHHRQRRFFFRELRVVDLAGGIIPGSQSGRTSAHPETIDDAAIDV
jgi:hypothetical protein